MGIAENVRTISSKMKRINLAQLMRANLLAVAAVLIAGGCSESHHAALEQANVPAMKETLVYLASDAQEGRGVGSAGLDRAAIYIADRFRVLGLKPGNGHSYFQTFEMTVAAKIDPATKLAIGDHSFEVNKDFVPLNFSAEKYFSGAAVFVGYGISSEKYKYDDYANVDVKGKVAVALRYEPHDEKGKSRFTHGDFSGEASLYAKAKAAAAHGAAGLLIVNPPTYHEGDSLFPFTHTIMERTTSVPVMHVKQSVGATLLGDLKEIQKKLDEGGKPISRELGVEIHGEVKIARERKPVKNVLAILPGKGPHKNEYIVVGAHYDHLGRGGLVPGAAGKNVIYYGADDNASGTTVMLELARREMLRGPRDRSILFIAFTAEEEGLIGSAKFAEMPPVPLEKIAYMMNLDMVGRLKDETLYVGGEGTAKDLQKFLDEADKELSLKFKSIGKGGYGPSDHQTFAMKKIPVLFLFTGLHADYHRPTDTWPKINFSGMDEIAEFGQRVVDELDTAPREAYVSTFDSQGIHLSGDPTAGNGATLGVIPDYVEDNSVTGVKISGAMPESPAAGIGLQAGDILVQFGDTKITNLYELSDALRAAKPGDKVAIKYLRGKEEHQATATLAQRKG
jgi:hypothetical protein